MAPSSSSLVSNLAPGSRMHIVMVPGFAGFDALGQIQYYAGTTGAFIAWRKAQPVTQSAVLHYFDNFPTAAVEERAHRLHVFLAKKILRGEIAADDKITLIGHSTGGLDIRKMLWDLNTSLDNENDVNFIQIDGVAEEATRVSHEVLVKAIDRVVFLSVPQYGTQIADFTANVQGLVQSAAEQLSQYISNLGKTDQTRKLAFLDSLKLFNSDLVKASLDCLREADEFPRAENLRSGERQNRFELSLWLLHVARDFRAILDLRTGLPNKSVSPAHFPPEIRKIELNNFRRLTYRSSSMETLSYATYARGLDKNAPVAKLASTLVKLVNDTKGQPSSDVENLVKNLLDPFLAVFRRAIELSDRLPTGLNIEDLEKDLFFGPLVKALRVTIAALEKISVYGESPSKDWIYLFAEAICTNSPFVYNDERIE